MKYSAIAALCAAPLALASVLDVAPVRKHKRDAVIIENSSSKSSESIVGGIGGASIQSVQSVQSTEIIIIWTNAGGDAATTTMNQASSASGAALATHTVTVGGAAGLVYTPSSINAAVGDMVLFEFESQNHTVTQSGFNTPCAALAGGFDTGFTNANPNNTVSPSPQVAMQVMVSTPLWFYCKQEGHCGKGMVFSINPTANKTQAMFEQFAIAQNGSAAGLTSGSGSSSGSSSVASNGTTVATSVVASSVATATTASMVTATGSITNQGACECACLCGVAAFPSEVQGLLNFGGMSGSVPVSALESA